jgi:hypothetical protein
VNPLLDEALGRFCYDGIQDLPVSVDIVDVFAVYRKLMKLLRMRWLLIREHSGCRRVLLIRQALAQARDAGL